VPTTKKRFLCSEGERKEERKRDVPISEKIEERRSMGVFGVDFVKDFVRRASSG
jgi:hypothetical protein